MTSHTRIKKIVCPECGYSMSEKIFKERHKNSKACKMNKKLNSKKL